MRANQPKSQGGRCGREACEIVISKLQQDAERNSRDWAARYQLGICYSGRCQPHSLVSPDLAVEHLRSACTSLPQAEEPLIRAAILNLLGIMYMSSSALPTRARLLGAIDCHEKAAAIYFEGAVFAEWARMQYNLGNTCCDLPDDEFPAKWEEAIAHYEQALLYRTRNADPDGFAATLENLGTAYRRRTMGDKLANIRRAIQCYRRALRLCTATSAPAHWAALHNNLGNACLSLPSTGRETSASHARHAIHHFDLALQVRTRERNLFDYGVTRLNRGQACLQLGLAGSSAWLAEAAGCLGDAYAALLRSRAPEQANLAQESLRLAQWALNKA